MFSGNKKGLALAALVFVFVTVSANAQTLIPGDMLGQLIRNMAYSHIPQNEFSRVFQNFTRSTYPGRNSFYQSEISGVTSSFVLYLYSNKIDAEWARNYPVPQRAAAPPQTAAPPPPPPPPPRFPATHRLTADLRLFSRQDAGSELVASLAKGTAVQVESWGEYAELDKIIAKWARVKTESGQSGWLWSGYLEEIR
jgi:hypothetical protein